MRFFASTWMFYFYDSLKFLPLHVFVLLMKEKWERSLWDRMRGRERESVYVCEWVQEGCVWYQRGGLKRTGAVGWTHHNLYWITLSLIWLKPICTNIKEPAHHLFNSKRTDHSAFPLQFIFVKTNRDPKLYPYNLGLCPLYRGFKMFMVLT